MSRRSLAAARREALQRMRTAWVAGLTPIIGTSDAMLLVEVVEVVAPLSRRVRHAEELQFLRSMGEGERRREAIRAKALRTCMLLLAWPDGVIEDELGNLVPSATWRALHSIARRLCEYRRAVLRPTRTVRFTRVP